MKSLEGGVRHLPRKEASQEEPSLTEPDSLAGGWQQVQLGPVVGALCPYW
jgi:hypothetical protein